MASTLAGNLTITGSVANIIVVERAQKEAVITFFDYFRIGLPVTLLTLPFGWLSLSLDSMKVRCAANAFRCSCASIFLVVCRSGKNCPVDDFVAVRASLFQTLP